jgi:Zn-finger nucleic acid-binding protein
MDQEAKMDFCCVELKYCERCGALWLRNAGRDESYCAVCFMQMKDTPQPKKRKNPVRAAHRNRKCTRDLQAVAQECTAPPAAIGDPVLYRNEAEL